MSKPNNSEGSNLYFDLFYLQLTRLWSRLFYIFILIAIAGFQAVFFRKMALIEISYFLLIVAALVVLIWQKPSAGLPTLATENKMGFVYLIPGLIFFISLAIKLYFNNKILFWGDEVYQQSNILEFGPIIGAANQQQPPLAYYITGWTAHFLNENNLALQRWPVLVISSFFLVLFYGMLKVLKVRTFLAALFTLFLFLNSVVFQYSIELRPQFMALMFGIQLVIELILSRNRNLTFKFFDTKVFAALFLFLLSAGMQPVIFLVAMAFLILLYSLILKRSTYMYIVYSSLSAGLVFLPLQLLIRSKSDMYVQPLNKVFHFPDARIESMFNLPLLFKFNTFAFTGVFLVLVFAYIGFKFARGKLPLLQRVSTKYFQMALWCFGLHLTMTSLMIIVFSTSINWSLNERYIIVNAILLFAGSGFLFQFINDLFTGFKVKKIIASIVIFGGSTLVFLKINGTELAVSHSALRNNVPNYQRIVSALNENDVIVPICNKPFLCWDYQTTIYLLLRFDKNEKSVPVQHPIYHTLSRVYKKQIIKGMHLFINHDVPLQHHSKFTQFSMISSTNNTMLFYLTGDSIWSNLENINLLLKRHNSEPKRYEFTHQMIDLLLSLHKHSVYGGPLLNSSKEEWEYWDLRNFFRDHKDSVNSVGK